MTRLPEYIKYHEASAKIGDIDPSYAMLRYVCDRFELNEEQRYWLAYVYALTYCGATTYYVYNEHPDYENLDIGRLTRWWYGGGRAASIFQTDARWRRSRNQVIDAIKSYQKWIGPGTQGEFFARTVVGETPEQRYDSLLKRAKELFTFGQFTLFLYLEALHVITPLDLCPTDLDLSKAWSCRNGLYYAYGLDQHIRDDESPIPQGAAWETRVAWADLRATLAELPAPPTVWQTETVLCAYRKWHRGKRWIGYYLDRQADEISKMADHVKRGVAWDVLWQYRAESYDHNFLAEHNSGIAKEGGILPRWKAGSIERTKELIA